MSNTSVTEEEEHSETVIKMERNGVFNFDVGQFVLVAFFVAGCVLFPCVCFFWIAGQF